jgi:hypothetical protein
MSGFASRAEVREVVQQQIKSVNEQKEQTMMLRWAFSKTTFSLRNLAER